MDVNFVNVGGLRTAFVHAGSGPALFLLHGQLPGSCVATEWGANVQRFADAGFEVYAPDLAGFGQTDAIPDHHIRIRIAHAKAFIDHFQPKRYSLWGCSMGTYISCAIAMEDPRADRLVIMPSSILPPPLPEGAPTAVPARESVAEMVRSNAPTLEMARTVLERVMRNKANLTDELVRLFYENWAPHVEDEKGRAKAGRPAPLWPEVKKLSNRALLLWGAEEALPERAILLQQCFQKAELVMLQTCGHWPQQDQPERTFELVTAFLRS